MWELDGDTLFVYIGNRYMLEASYSGTWKVSIWSHGIREVLDTGKHRFVEEGKRKALAAMRGIISGLVDVTDQIDIAMTEAVNG